MRISDFLIFSSKFRELTQASPLVLIDVGARGELDPPWGLLDEASLQLVGFEPDTEECKRLNALSPSNFKYYPNALWDSVTTREVHVAQVASCSSVYPPNQSVLQVFEEDHVACRNTVSKESFECTSLDIFCSQHSIHPDFVKIDTQGSEYEIIRGARGSLQNDVFGVITETWLHEVHKGQALSSKIQLEMNELGFEVFDINIAAAWNRKGFRLHHLNGKRQIVGLDFLFLKKLENCISWSKEKIIKAAATAEAYGFADYSFQLIDHAENIDSQTKADLFDLLKNKSRLRSSLLGKVKRKAKSVLGSKEGNFASLHY